MNDNFKRIIVVMVFVGLKLTILLLPEEELKENKYELQEQSYQFVSETPYAVNSNTGSFFVTGLPQIPIKAVKHL